MLLQRFFENLVYHGLESIGRFYSVYRGHVVDNEDPDGLNRIKVIIPVIAGKAEHPTWAYPRDSFSGDGYGAQILPQKGDMVMVEFEHGDPKFPIWSHAHYSLNQKPIEFDSPQVYGFKTPKGQMVIIDDRDGVEKIILSSNAYLVLRGDKVVIESSETFIQGEIRGVPRFAIGANGVFATTDGKIIQVTNGLITGIT